MPAVDAARPCSVGTGHRRLEQRQICSSNQARARGTFGRLQESNGKLATVIFEPCSLGMVPASALGKPVQTPRERHAAEGEYTWKPSGHRVEARPALGQFSSPYESAVPAGDVGMTEL